MIIKKARDLPPLAATLTPTQEGDVLELDVLELDELWSFVFRRKDKRWIWLAQCRRTRQVVAYCTGRPGRRHRGP